MSPRKIALLIITLLYLGVASFLSWEAYSNGHEFKVYRTENAKVLDSKERLTDLKEWFDVSKLFDGGKSNTELSNEATENAEFYYANAVNYVWILATVSLIYFLTVLFLYRKTTWLYKNLSLALILIAFMFLAVGISVPMLEIGAYTDAVKDLIPLKGTIPIIGTEFDFSDKFNGRMYFFYQNKSIIDVIGLLFNNGNILVGVSILLFSIVSPLLKLFFSLYIVFYPSNKNKVIGFIVNNLGKWSMADVYVVSIFLGYLSFQNISAGVDTEAQTLVGLYCFLGFVVISIISSMLLKVSVKRQKETIIIN